MNVFMNASWVDNMSTNWFFFLSSLSLKRWKCKKFLELENTVFYKKIWKKKFRQVSKLEKNLQKMSKNFKKIQNNSKNIFELKIGSLTWSASQQKRAQYLMKLFNQSIVLCLEEIIFEAPHCKAHDTLFQLFSQPK